jgi:hypothetical protein
MNRWFGRKASLNSRLRARLTFFKLLGLARVAGQFSQREAISYQTALKLLREGGPECRLRHDFSLH